MTGADKFVLWEVVIAAPFQNAFALLYGFRSPWWITPAGRALLIKGVGLALVLDVTALFYWLGADYPGRDAVRIAVFGIVLVGIIYQLAVLVRTQAHGHLLLDQTGPDDLQSKNRESE